VIRDWEAIPSGASWTSPPLFAFRASRALIEDRFGAAQAVALDSNGWGPFDAWIIRFECGLEIALWHMQLRPDGSAIKDRHELANVHVLANRPEEKHILFHLGLEPKDLSPWEPSALVAEPLVWRLVRQDDNGKCLRGGALHVAMRGTLRGCDVRSARAQADVSRRGAELIAHRDRRDYHPAPAGIAWRACFASSGSISHVEPGQSVRSTCHSPHDPRSQRRNMTTRSLFGV
jgi:hypothetical protein